MYQEGKLNHRDAQQELSGESMHSYILLSGHWEKSSDAAVELSK